MDRLVGTSQNSFQKGEAVPYDFDIAVLESDLSQVIASGCNEQNCCFVALDCQLGNPIQEKYAAFIESFRSCQGMRDFLIQAHSVAHETHVK